MEINNDTIKIIQSKIPLYLNKTYFRIFKDILIDSTMKSLRNDNFNTKKNNNNDKNKLDITSINKNDKFSLWLNIMKNIYIKKEIKDYNLKKSLLDNELNLYSNKNDEDYCYVFFQNKKKKYETSNLVYLYLSHLSKIKIQKFKIISKKENTPLTNILRIYLGLCAQNIITLKINSIDINNNENEINHKKLYSRKNLITKLSLKDEITKKDNNIKNEINNETKFNNIAVKIKYISELKTRLAKKFIISRNKENNKKIEKNKNDNENDIDNENNNDKNEEEKKIPSKISEDLLNEEFIKSLNNLNKKAKNASLKVLYSSSFTRLFIGETDIESIRERYLSNIDAKKEEKIGKKNKKINNTSETYLKLFSNKIIQNESNKLPLIEKSMETLVTKFKKNQEIIDRFKRLSSEEGKNNYIFNSKDKNIYDSIYKANTASKYENKIKTNLNIDIIDTNNTNDINNNNYISLSNKKFNKIEIIKTPEKEKDKIRQNNNKLNYIQINKKIKNLSFNKIGNKNIYKLKHNKTINEYNYKGRNNKKIFKLTIKNQLFPNIDDKSLLLTERNNISKKLFRNKDELMNKNDIFLKSNLTTRVERYLYKDRLDNILKSKKTKNFFTKNDLYF